MLKKAQPAPLNFQPMSVVAKWLATRYGGGLGPGDILLDVDPARLKGGHSSPAFWPMSIVAKTITYLSC